MCSSVWTMCTKIDAAETQSHLNLPKLLDVSGLGMGGSPASVLLLITVLREELSAGSGVMGRDEVRRLFQTPSGLTTLTPQ